MAASTSLRGRTLVAALLAGTLGLSGVAPAREAPPTVSPASLHAATPRPAIPGIDADVRLLHHDLLIFTDS